MAGIDSLVGSYERLERACAELEAPFALLDLDAFGHNADDLVRRALGKPIRVASKSVRCREILSRTLGRPGFSGILGFTLPEALWLAERGFDDIVVAYPTTDRHALRQLASSSVAKQAVTLVVDALDQIELIAQEITNADSDPVRVCIDIDAGYALAGGRVELGAKRSPLHSAAQCVALAREIVTDGRFELDGLMAYEAQIASVGDRPKGKRAMWPALRAFRAASARELAKRRGEIVAAVSGLVELRFVNGGGTGSFETTAREGAVTELAAGSGLYGPALFDSYSAFHPRPAALFALPVVRRPGPGVVTALGGGYIASGAIGADRLPEPYLPTGLALDKMEGAGEVQTPLHGRAADRLAIGDRVYLRHAKAGELCERFNTLYLLEGDRVIDEVPTYRGEGKAFL